MFVCAADSRRVASLGALVWPLVWAAVLVLAVFLAPFRVASVWPGGGYPSRTALVDSLSSGFIHYSTGGSALMGPDLACPVDFWARFHVLKAALAGVLVLVLVSLGSRSWRVYTRAGRPRRRLVVGALMGVEVPTALVAIVVLVANIQGAVAPLSSALGLLPIDRPDPVLAETIAQVRHGLRSGTRSPTLELLVHDFTRYHLAMSCLGAAATVSLVVAVVLLGRRRSRMSVAPHRGRGVLALAVVAAVVSSGFFAVVTAANVSTVARPVPALLAFFEGSG